MGFEAGKLKFWRVKQGKNIDALVTNKALDAGELPLELEDIPIDAIVLMLNRVYPSLNVKSKYSDVDIPEDETAFEIQWGSKHIHINFYGDAFNHMHRIARIMARQKLACYDVFANKVFPRSRPPNYLETPEEKAYWAVLEAVYTDLNKALDQQRITDPKERLGHWARFLRSDDGKTTIKNRIAKDRATSSGGSAAFSG